MPSAALITALAIALPSNPVPAHGSGTLSHPMQLSHPAAIKALCDGLGAAPLEENQVAAPAPTAAAERIYSALVDPTGFQFTLRDDGRLAIDLRRSLAGASGALKLNVINETVGDFKLTEEEMRGLQTRKEDKQLMLRVTFRVDQGDSDLPACFSYPRSEVYSMRIEALSIEIVDLALNGLVRTRIENHADAGDKKPVLRIRARPVSGPVDVAGVTDRLEAMRPILEGCFATTLASSQGSGLLGFAVGLASSGAVSAARLEIESLDDEGPVKCVRTVLSKFVGPRTSRGGTVNVILSVEHEEG